METEKNYKVSILLAAYNTIDYIRRCLDSIPIRDDVEVVLIDDCSDDGTEIELLKYCHTNPNARLIRNKTNIGFALSKNIGYDNCKGEYITQLDSDDYYVTAKINDIIDNDLKADIVYFDLKSNDGHVWHSEPKTRYIIMDHVSFIKRDLIGDHRCPNVPWGSGVALNNAIQADLDKKKGSVIYTGKIAYMYNFPREGSILDKRNKGLL